MIHRDTTISNNIDNDSNDDGDHMWSYNSDNGSNTNKINHNDKALWVRLRFSGVAGVRAKLAQLAKWIILSQES